MRKYWIISFVIGSLFVKAGDGGYSVASGSIGIMHVELGIFGEQLTRSQAAQRCVEYGYDNLEDGQLDYIRYVALKQKLQELGTTFNGAGQEFWGDFFRLDDTSSTWYKTELCWEVTGILQLESQANAGDNCIAVKFWDGFYEVIHRAANCQTYLPFICIKTNLTLPPFKVYTDATLLQLPEHSSIVPVSGAGSFSKCVDECRAAVDCIAITFEDSTFTCELLTIDPDMAYLSYQLMYKYGYTHAAKVGTEVIFYSATTPVSGGSETLAGEALPCGGSVSFTSLSPFSAVPTSPSSSSMFDRPFSSTEVSAASASSLASSSGVKVTPTPSSIDVSTTISNSDAPTWSYTTLIPMTASVSPAAAFNVTAYIRLQKTVAVHMYEDEVTWFDAIWRCSENESRLESASTLIAPRKTMIKQYLRDGYHWSDSNFTFWTGLFKPTPTKNKWYSSNITLCYEAEQPDDLPADISDDMQCSVAKFGGTAIGDDVTVTADICSKKHPYYCIDWITDETSIFTEYNGWNYRSIPANAIEQIQDNVTTSENCAQICQSQWKCTSWSYFYAHAKCNMLKTRNGFAHVTYELWPSTEGVTHGCKRPYDLTLHPRTASHNSDPQFQQTFPTCYMTTTTSSTDVTSTSTSTTSSQTSLTSQHYTIANSTSTATTTGYFTLTSKHSTTANSASTSTSRHFTLTSQYSTAANSTCKRNCPCRNSTTYTATELQAVVEEIIQNLTINKAETSKARRELTSAEDSRTSAQAVGGLGIAILSFVFAGIVILDAPRILSVFWVRVK